MYADKITNTDGSEFAFASAGVNFGGKIDQGGAYIGTASYLMMKGEIEYNDNGFIFDDLFVDSVCINLNADKTGCGAKRKATPGTYKFSLYGYSGESWEG